MRLHIPHVGGSGDGLCGFEQETKEPITVTPAEIIYQRRVAVLAAAATTGNVAATCRTFGISRTRYYQWKKAADAYGLDALWPKERRRPQMPEATPTHVVERLLTLAVLEPTIGCRQYADRLADQGFAIAKSTVQKILVTHGLATRRQRLARAAAVTAMTTGLLTDAAREDEPFGFCLATGGPGELVCLLAVPRGLAAGCPPTGATCSCRPTSSSGTPRAATPKGARTRSRSPTASRSSTSSGGRRRPPQHRRRTGSAAGTGRAGRHRAARRPGRRSQWRST